MRVISLLVAVASVAPSMPAHAAYYLSISGVPVEGITTTTPYVFGCPAPAIPCPPVTNVAYTNTIGGGLGVVNALTGTLNLGGFFNYPTGSYNVTLSFLNGSLFSSSLLGQDYGPNGGCPGPCTTFSTTFHAENFSVSAYDISTGLTTILAPVPEPATWALMLLGFGAIGYSMRRTRKVARSLTT